MPKRYTEKEFIKAFWSRVKISDFFSCWEWQAATNSAGYGHVGRSGRHILCHRLAWEFAYGPIRNGLCVLHKCDNPPCVNPNHLFQGTIRDNSLDMVKKGRARWNSAVGEQCAVARLSQSQVLLIRSLKSEGKSAVELGVAFGVTRGHIHKIVSGESWNHIAIV